MKAIAKVLLVGAVVAATIAMSAAPSDARVRELELGNWWGQLCATACVRGQCKVMVWFGAESKWIPGIQEVCTQPGCPQVCKLRGAPINDIVKPKEP